MFFLYLLLELAATTAQVKRRLMHSLKLVKQIVVALDEIQDVIWHFFTVCFVLLG